MRVLTRAAAAALTFFAVSALAAIVVVDQQGRYARDGITYESRNACVTAAQAGIGADPRTCEQVNRVIVSANCDGVPKPPEPASEIEGHLCPDSDTRWYFTEPHQVKIAYPACWQVQAVPVSDCAAHVDPWAPGPDSWVPPVDPYVQVAP